VEGVCDVCGSTLYQREDDKTETILHRIEVYENQTAPLIDYYEKKGVLNRVDGNRTIDEVSADILSVIRAGCGLKE
jgi:adenylate kinase